MAEACDFCSCGLSEPDVDSETVEIASQLQFQEVVREYVLDQLDLDDDSTFIEEVKVCPERVEVTYSGDE